MKIISTDAFLCTHLVQCPTKLILPGAALLIFQMNVIPILPIVKKCGYNGIGQPSRHEGVGRVDLGHCVTASGHGQAGPLGELAGAQDEAFIRVFCEPKQCSRLRAKNLYNLKSFKAA